MASTHNSSTVLLNDKENNNNNNNIIRFWMNRNRKIFNSSSSSGVGSGSGGNKPEFEAKSMLNTVSEIVDFNQNYLLNDRKPIMETKSSQTSTSSSKQHDATMFLKRAVHEPANKLNDLKTKSQRYEHMSDSTLKTAMKNDTNDDLDEKIFKSNGHKSAYFLPNDSMIIDNSNNNVETTIQQQQQQNTTTSTQFKSNNFFNRVLSNLIHAKEFRASHEVFKDDDDDNSTISKDKTKRGANKTAKNSLNQFQSDFENDLTKY